MDFTEKTLSSRKIFDGRVVKLKIDTVELPDGNEAEREIIEHPGGVCVLAVDDENNVLMVRQYRNGAEDVLLELPAGKLEVGEDHFECGKRELEEETGMVAEHYEYLGFFYPTPAYCQERIHMYFACGLNPSCQKLDEGEFLEVIKIPYSKLYEMALNNEIYDGKTVIAILKAKSYIKDNI